MIRLSDFLKKKVPALSLLPEEEPLKPQLPILPETMNHEESSREEAKKMEIVKVMAEAEPDLELSKKLYCRGIELARELLKNAKEEKPIEINSISDLAEDVINCFVLGNRAFFSLFYESYPPLEYLFHHIVNVMMMSIALGLKLGYNKSQLGELGLAAFLHDTGMIKQEEIILQPRPLSKEEYNRVKEHPVCGVEILSKIKNILQAVIPAVGQHHERLNGEGYPQGIKKDEISEYAQIIAVIDTYEVLVHDRVYKKKLLSYEAINRLLSSKGALFDSQILKILIDLIGVYPVGSYVKLNSDKIGKVIKPNDNSPLRPVVCIIFEADRNKIEQTYLVDLAKETKLYIERPVLDEEILSLKIKEE